MSSKQRNLFSYFQKKPSNNFKSENETKSSQASYDAEEVPEMVRNEDCVELLKQSSHIDKVIDSQSEQDVGNRLSVRLSIDAVRFLSFQGISFRSYDESLNFGHSDNFIELVKFLASFDDEVQQNALGNAIHTSFDIQEKSLQVFAHKVRKKICDDIGDSRFCIIVDEACGDREKEQIALILRFLDIKGFVQERFFHVAHLKDISSSTIYSEICSILAHYGLNILNIRGQGYDGDSIMHGEWNKLQALFLNECPQAYYVHCFAHGLQLALVRAAKGVFDVYEFFYDISLIVKAVTSCKHRDELQVAHIQDVAFLIAIDEVEIGTGDSQIGTLKRACETQRSSHLGSIHTLLNTFDTTCEVLEKIEEGGGNSDARGYAFSALNQILSFRFIFTAHLMYEIFSITEHLCMTLQEESQDILKAMDTVRSTSVLLQRLRMDGWNSFILKVESFCSRHDIDIPDLSAPHFLGRSKHHLDNVSLDHHYHVDVFNATIDFQLQELASRFNDRITEHLRLSSSLNPKDKFASFDIPSICMLASNYYPQDFTCLELELLKYQLQHFHCDVTNSADFRGLSTIGALCQVLAATEKRSIYFLIDRLIRLILTLPVFTATTERAFSAIKSMNTRLQDMMENEVFDDSLLLYIEKDIAKSFSSEELIDDVIDFKEYRVVS